MRDQERPEKVEIEAQLKAEGAAPRSAEFLRLAELGNELMIPCLATCALVELPVSVDAVGGMTHDPLPGQERFLRINCSLQRFLRTDCVRATVRLCAKRHREAELRSTSRLWVRSFAGANLA